MMNPYECFQYQKLLLMVYDNHHALIKNGVDQLLRICEDMHLAMQQNPRLFSWQEQAYVEEFQAMGWYYKGYDSFIHKQYDVMLECYDTSIAIMKNTQLENRYALLVDMELSCFQYGIKDEEKSLHIDRLDRAWSYASHMRSEEEQTYFQNKIHEEMTYWRN